MRIFSSGYFFFFALFFFYPPSIHAVDRLNYFKCLLNSTRLESIERVSIFYQFPSYECIFVEWAELHQSWEPSINSIPSKISNIYLPPPPHARAHNDTRSRENNRTASSYFVSSGKTSYEITTIAIQGNQSSNLGFSARYLIISFHSVNAET